MFFSPARLSLALSLVSCLPSLQAQDSGGFFSDYLTFLNSTGYTAFSSALQQAQSTDSGKQWIDQLSNGQWTVFAPSNQAFSSAPSNVSSDPGTYLSYHYVYGNAFGSQNSSSGGGSGGGGSSSQSQSQSTSSSGGGGGSQTSSSPQSSSTASGYSRRAFWFKLPFLQSGGDGSSNSSLGNVTATYPNTTIGRTLLNNSTLVQLEGPQDGNNSRHQVLAWSQSQENGVFVLNQVQNTTVGNTTTWRNLLIANIDHVLVPPGNVSAALTAVNDTALLNLLNTIQVPSSSGGGGNVSALQAAESARGFTFFAPSQDAFTSEFNNTLQGLQGNQSALATLLQNHYANGTTRYSPSLNQLAQANSSSSGGGSGGSGGSGSNSTSGGQLFSAAGEPFSFSQNSTGLFVSNGNGTSAQVIRPDILVQNGVIHLIDRFLFNEQSNPAAASSAISSASAAATESSTDTAIIGISTSGGSQSSTSSSPQSSSSSSSQSSSSSGSQSSSSTSTSGGSSASPSTSSQAGYRFARNL
ncbi:hypothetical protein DFP72DRAFT_1003275 [Ephemerocybe angulata]|uniref:FAS1 domain-containing protein n=1 Tax=Ephemerocybe angulata TaxID=980116 RepID=A0A8H6ICP0_9AGAR|nr:hypothetical protein DFP72DRAFT_1010838 [Tulosesus angulatus]KAF6761371.1 hypothetical protein DFP72DRAFT_1003275 [Tulosesus angulatus]